MTAALEQQRQIVALQERVSALEGQMQQLLAMHQQLEGALVQSGTLITPARAQAARQLADDALASAQRRLHGGEDSGQASPGQA